MDNTVIRHCVESYVIRRYDISVRKEGELQSEDRTSDYKPQLQSIYHLPVKKGLKAICAVLGFEYDYNDLEHITMRESIGETIISLRHKKDNDLYIVRVNIQKVITAAPTVHETDNLIR